MLSSILGRSFHYQNFGTEGQRIVAKYIFDDSIQIMSTFEMNRFASLTYGDVVRDQMFDMLEYVLLLYDYIPFPLIMNVQRRHFIRTQVFTFLSFSTSSFSFSWFPNKQPRDILKTPDDFSVLSIQKSLSLIKHVIIYGSEKCVNMAWNMTKVIEDLKL